MYFGFVGLRLTPDTTQPADNSTLTLSASASSTIDSAPTPDAGTQADDSASNVTDNEQQPATERTGIYPAVLSIGFNPYYSNPTRSIEIHILHAFPRYNFYHAPLNLLILGFIRPEYDYESLGALVDDIKMDCEVARRSLERTGYVRKRQEEEGWLGEFGWMERVDVGEIEGEVLGGDEGKNEKAEEGEGKL